MYALPPFSHPFLAAISASGLSLLSQLWIGWFTDALPDHPHDPLQQSQYRVVFPEPDTADTVQRLLVRVKRVRVLSVSCMVDEVAGVSFRFDGGVSRWTGSWDILRYTSLYGPNSLPRNLVGASLSINYAILSFSTKAMTNSRLYPTAS
jgi:hypothetical protein